MSWLPIARILSSPRRQMGRRGKRGAIMASLTDTVPVPDDINRKSDGTPVRSAKQATMLTLLGNPRADLTDECQSVANSKLKTMMVTASVGPFRVTGLRPAVDSLASVLAEIKRQKSKVHAQLSSAGMLCVRHVRKVPSAISNHAWGTAIDLKIAGILDKWDDGTVQLGLTEIAPIFNEAGWFWGAAFSREDGMHFECGDDLIRDWAKQGLFGGATPPPPEDGLLSLGDRGEEVGQLQKRLNELGALLLVDKVFGRETQSAVMAFQAREGLPVDGVVGNATLAALKSAKPPVAEMPPAFVAAAANRPRGRGQARPGGH